LRRKAGGRVRRSGVPRAVEKKETITTSRGGGGVGGGGKRLLDMLFDCTGSLALQFQMPLNQGDGLCSYLLKNNESIVEYSNRSMLKILNPDHQRKGGANLSSIKTLQHQGKLGTWGETGRFGKRGAED